ncbi:head GIN domain-containing protein [soil metagenome]
MRHPALLAPVLLVAACGGNASAGPQTTRSFAVGGFTAVELAGSDDVRVVRGSQASVTATGPADVLDRLDIHVEGDRLKISRKRKAWNMGWGGGSHRGAMVTVTTPGITAATLAGSGNLSVDRVSGDSFKGSLAGSGNLVLANVRVTQVALDLAGSGNLGASGVVRDARLNVGGSGGISALDLVSQTADVSLGGSGDVQVTARDHAKISIAGSGNVTVKGTTNCQIAKVGSGDARCAP